MERTQEEILAETGGVMTSESSRGTMYGGDEPSDAEKEELIAGDEKHNLNGDGE